MLGVLFSVTFTVILARTRIIKVLHTYLVELQSAWADEWENMTGAADTASVSRAVCVPFKPFHIWEEFSCIFSITFGGFL